ncbi:hypothetical protein HDU76_003176 [Blyttiomyces sp. JEL0837]|nr:hypothetical protein HDU76_003176 [Blyttiomyces sp. JEL0837]
MPLKNLTSSSPVIFTIQTRSLWDTLPPEIKSKVLSNTDSLTRYLHNDFTSLQLEIYGNDVWRIIFEQKRLDLDFNLLPKDQFPTIFNGLHLANSKRMYRKKEDDINDDLLKAFLESSELLEWIEKDNRMDRTNSAVLNDESLLKLSRLPHIAICNKWKPSYFPSWWNYVPDIKIFIMACHFEHIDIATSVINDLEKNDFEGS